MLLSVIIVSYNTKNLTLQTINSVLENIAKSQKLQKQTEIIVIDNNSKDDSVTQIKRLFTSAPKYVSTKLIVNKKNTGFAIANNQGITHSTGKYIFLLNSDTIVQPGSLESLVKTFEQTPTDNTTADLSSSAHKLDRLGILAASLENPDGSYQPQGGSFPTLVSLFFHMFMIDDIPLIGNLVPSTQHTGLNIKSKRFNLTQKDWVAATAMIIKREVINEIGLLDKDIFMYGEDVEYCLRAKNHHWDVAIDPNSHITHLGSASSSAKNAIIGEFKAYIYIWSKHKPIWQMWFVKAILWWGSLLRLLIFGTIINDQQKKQAYTQILKEVII